MTVRTSMADLIGRVRTLISDPSGANSAFDDQTVQDALDARQTVVRYAVLRPEPTIAPTGIVDKSAYRDYYAAVGDWEGEVVLYDSAFGVLTPTTSDLLVGHWVITAGQLPPVYLVGKTYDRYAAAADLLEQWAAKVKLEYDFVSGQRSFKRAQQAKALLELAQSYRARQRPQTATMVRGDVEAGVWPGGFGSWPFDWTRSLF